MPFFALISLFTSSSSSSTILYFCCGLDKAQAIMIDSMGVVIHDRNTVCAHNITAHSLKIELRAFEKLVYNLIKFRSVPCSTHDHDERFHSRKNYERCKLNI